MTDAILKARHTTLVALIESCHSLVYRYEFSGDNPLCKHTANRDECDALTYGHLVRQLQKLGLWPGNPKEIADTMEAGSVEKLVGNIKSIKSYIYPGTNTNRDYYYHNHGPTSMHANCGCATELHNEAEKAVTGIGSEIIESNCKQLETRWKELEGSQIDLSKYQT